MMPNWQYHPKQIQYFPLGPDAQVALRNFSCKIFLHAAIHSGRVHGSSAIPNAHSTLSGAKTKNPISIIAMNTKPHLLANTAAIANLLVLIRDISGLKTHYTSAHVFIERNYGSPNVFP